MKEIDSPLLLMNTKWSLVSLLKSDKLLEINSEEKILSYKLEHQWNPKLSTNLPPSKLLIKVLLTDIMPSSNYLPNLFQKLEKSTLTKELLIIF